MTKPQRRIDMKTGFRRCGIWAAAAAIGLVSRRESDFGRAIVLPAMVETYAVVGLLAGILILNFLQ